jgi:hypothetical protein
LRTGRDPRRCLSPISATDSVVKYGHPSSLSTLELRAHTRMAPASRALHGIRTPVRVAKCNDGRWRRITADFRRQLPRPRVAERLVAAAASRSLIPTFPSGVSPGRVDRAPMARSKPAPTYSATDASPSKPSTDAPCHVARPSIESSSIDPTTPGHTSRSARAPRRTSFPAPRRPPSATTNQRRRFPEPKRLPPMSPSTPVRGRRLATASSRSPQLPARTRLRMRVLNPVRSGGPPLVPRVLPPWPSVRHAFTSRLTPSR